MQQCYNNTISLYNKSTMLKCIQCYNTIDFVYNYIQFL